MQPFAMWMYTYSFIVILGGDYWVCDYKSFPRLIMAEIEIKNLHKSFGDFIAVKEFKS